jgi:hypothetical protein
MDSQATSLLSGPSGQQVVLFVLVQHASGFDGSFRLETCISIQHEDYKVCFRYDYPLAMYSPLHFGAAASLTKFARNN